MSCTPETITVRPADVTIRRAIRSDARRMFELVEELAVYEQAAHEVEINEVQLIDCCFGPRAFCGAFVAEWKSPSMETPVVIGMAIYFFRFHTWKGRQIYLEEFVVSNKYRGGGVGKRLFDRVVQHGQSEKCSSMFWQVLDWNTPAINFYKKYKTDFDLSWLNCTLHFSNL